MLIVNKITSGLQIHLFIINDLWSYDIKLKCRIFREKSHADADADADFPGKDKINQGSSLK